MMKRLILVFCLMLFSAVAVAAPADVGAGYADFVSANVVAMASGGGDDTTAGCNNSASDPVKMATCKSTHKVTDKYSLADSGELFGRFNLLNSKPDKRILFIRRRYFRDGKGAGKDADSVLATPGHPPGSV